MAVLEPMHLQSPLCFAEKHEPGVRHRQLVAAAQKFPPIRTAVVHPCDDASIVGAFEARDERLIVPVLVGPTAKIRKAAQQAHLSLDGIDIVDTPHSHAAAAKAVAMARSGEVEALMKNAAVPDKPRD